MCKNAKSFLRTSFLGEVKVRVLQPMSWLYTSMLVLMLCKLLWNQSIQKFYEIVMIRIWLSNRKGIWHNGSTIEESYWLAKSNSINVQPNYPNAVKARRCLSIQRFTIWNGVPFLFRWQNKFEKKSIIFVLLLQIQASE